MHKAPCTSPSSESMSSTSSCRSFSCAAVQDECLFHTVIADHNLFAGAKGHQIQLHVLRKSEYPHNPYLYCYSSDDCDNYITFPSYQPVISPLVQSELSISSKASSFAYNDYEDQITEIIYDYDFADANYATGQRITLFLMQPSWTTSSVNLSLNFITQADASKFIRHILGATPYVSAGESSLFVLEPKSFRLGKEGQSFAPHEGQRDSTSSIEFFKDVNERRRMCFTGNEGRVFSGWIHGHPFSPRSPPSMDMIINVKVNVVARRVHVNSFKDTQETLKQAMYLSKFKVYIESGIDIYYQDTTDFASDFSRIAQMFIHGQILFEREVDFVFKTNYGLREEEKKDATLYLCHRSSGDLSFQQRVRPNFWRKNRGVSVDSEDVVEFGHPCAMVMYIRWKNWAHVAEISTCSIRRDNIDPCTITLSGQPPYPRRVRIGEDHSEKFPFWLLDDYLQQEDSFQLARIRFKSREETDLFLRQKEVLKPNMCHLCKTRQKRVLASHLPPDDIHESLKTCLISSLAAVSLISFQAEDVESSQLIHPFSHTVKQFLNKHRDNLKGSIRSKQPGRIGHLDGYH